MFPNEIAKILDILKQHNQSSWTISHHANGGLELHVQWSTRIPSVQHVSALHRQERRKSAATKRRDQERLQRYLQNRRQKPTTTDLTPTIQDTQVSVVDVQIQTNTCTCVQQMCDSAVQTESHTAMVSVATECRPSRTDGATQVDAADVIVMDSAKTELASSSPVSTQFREDISNSDVGCVEKSEMSAENSDSAVPEKRWLSMREHHQMSACFPTTPKPKITEKIMRGRMKNGSAQYLVKWRDHSPTKNTWVPEKRLDTIGQNYLKENTVKIKGRRDAVMAVCEDPPSRPQRPMDTVKETYRILSEILARK